ncbi:Uncharacterised protein [Mycoplasmopsis californica]|uniref:CvpA family protein n=1 Tax=Mycoplasmopsis equigenitalium TaxID=114883 RepID=A0ABY5J2G2_9BACT|nr:CvpA family protein [Mycoplasmopsis equigenitalium]UUD36909.1 CvpA family protein [Mycoplasmopsis equigenitalium]VEU69796.1 Uncharacterised protein [Mycoplasmopsis californica]
MNKEQISPVLDSYIKFTENNALLYIPLCVFIGVLLIGLLLGVWKGIWYSLYFLGIGVLSLLLSIAIAPPIANALKDKFVSDPNYQQIVDNHTSMFAGIVALVIWFIIFTIAGIVFIFIRLFFKKKDKSLGYTLFFRIGGAVAGVAGASIPAVLIANTASLINSGQSKKFDDFLDKVLNIYSFNTGKMGSAGKGVRSLPTLAKIGKNLLEIESMDWFYDAIFNGKPGDLEGQKLQEQQVLAYKPKLNNIIELSHDLVHDDNNRYNVIDDFIRIIEIKFNEMLDASGGSMNLDSALYKKLSLANALKPGYIDNTIKKNIDENNIKMMALPDKITKLFVNIFMARITVNKDPIEDRWQPELSDEQRQKLAEDILKKHLDIVLPYLFSE